MLFHIADFGALFEKEAVNAVVLGILAAAVVDAAAGDDDDVAVGADIEVVIDRFFDAALGQDHGDVHALVPGAGFDMNINAAAVRLGDDVDVGGGVPAGKLAVGAEIVGTGRHAVQVGNFLDQAFLNGIQFDHCSALLTTAAGRRRRCPSPDRAESRPGFRAG